MASNQGLNSLATIIKRLEAATSRLEDITELQAQQAAAHLSPSSSTGTATNHTTTGAAKPPPSGHPPSASVPAPPTVVVAAVEDPPSLKAYDDQVTPALKSFVELSGSLSPVLAEQVDSLSTLFTLQRNLIQLAAASTKPSDTYFQQTLLAPFIAQITSINTIKDKNRSGPNKDWFNHLNTIAEGVPALGWVTQMKPAPYIGEMKNAAQFYSNRVIKEYKDKDKKHVEWCKGFNGLMDTLEKYVKEYHTTGLVWNPRGGDPTRYTAPSSSTASISTSSSAPPPPPPPPPPPVFDPSSPSAPHASSPATPSSSGGGGAAAVLAQINRGEDVTKGLRKVAKEEMTHKNPSLRVSSVVPASASAGAGTSGAGPNRAPSPGPGKRPIRPAKPSALAGKKPSKMALEGQKWIVDYFENENSLVIEETQINQVVNLYGCKNVVLQVKGKINGISMVNCTKTSILVDSVISGIVITSSPSFALQITGKASTIQVDSCDGGQIYISKDCLGDGSEKDSGVEILTAKCSAINVSVPEPGSTEEGIFVERAVPEMMRSVVRNGQLVTSIVEMSG